MDRRLLERAQQGKSRNGRAARQDRRLQTAHRARRLVVQQAFGPARGVSIQGRARRPQRQRRLPCRQRPHAAELKAAIVYCLSMILSENRFPLFGIMLYFGFQPFFQAGGSCESMSTKQMRQGLPELLTQAWLVPCCTRMS